MNPTWAVFRDSFLNFSFERSKNGFCFISAGTIFQISGPKYEMVSKLHLNNSCNFDSWSFLVLAFWNMFLRQSKLVYENLRVLFQEHQNYKNSYVYLFIIIKNFWIVRFLNHIGFLIKIFSEYKLQNSSCIKIPW